MRLCKAVTDISWVLCENHRAGVCSSIFVPGPHANSTKYYDWTHSTEKETETQRLSELPCPKLLNK